MRGILFFTGPNSGELPPFNNCRSLRVSCGARGLLFTSFAAFRNQAAAGGGFERPMQDVMMLFERRLGQRRFSREIILDVDRPQRLEPNRAEERLQMQTDDGGVNSSGSASNRV